MAQVKTSELIGSALDWAVANCEGIDVEVISARMITECRHASLTPDEVASLPAPKPYLVVPGTGIAAYSTNWSQGGPIIEREGMNLSTVDALNSPYWEAHMPYGMSDDFAEGPTPLIAAMRCYVTSKLGDVVEVPDELIK